MPIPESKRRNNDIYNAKCDRISARPIKPIGNAIRAAATAQAEDFIWSRPQHFLTPVAQGGSNVSGGQRQRLSIARAIAKHPQVYLFDDSFSALDFKTDAQVRAHLKRATKGATVLIVAQRVAVAMDADMVIVLDEGRIDSIGTHEELLKTNKIYQEVYNSQTQGGGDFDKQGGEQ